MIEPVLDGLFPSRMTLIFIALLLLLGVWKTLELLTWLFSAMLP